MQQSHMLHPSLLQTAPNSTVACSTRQIRISTSISSSHSKATMLQPSRCSIQGKGVTSQPSLNGMTTPPVNPWTSSSIRSSTPSRSSSILKATACSPFTAATPLVHHQLVRRACTPPASTATSTSMLPLLLALQQQGTCWRTPAAACAAAVGQRPAAAAMQAAAAPVSLQQLRLQDLLHSTRQHQQQATATHSAPTCTQTYNNQHSQGALQQPAQLLPHTTAQDQLDCTNHQHGQHQHQQHQQHISHQRTLLQQLGHSSQQLHQQHHQLLQHHHQEQERYDPQQQHR